MEKTDDAMSTKYRVTNPSKISGPNLDDITFTSDRFCRASGKTIVKAAERSSPDVSCSRAGKAEDDLDANQNDGNPARKDRTAINEE